MKVAVIGDIHGNLEKLVALLEKLPEDVKRIYSVGDLIDRGSDSKGVVQLCIDRDIKAVRGNHEDMFLDILNGTKEYDNGTFEMNGGDKTIESYGGTCIRTDAGYGYSNYVSECEIPEDHKKYIESMPIFIETDDFILSHAGIHPMRVGGYGVEKWDSGSDKSNMDLMWNRDGLANTKKLQIIGHTPQNEVAFKKIGEDVKSVNVDTGCAYGNKLSALILPTMEIVSANN